MKDYSDYDAKHARLTILKELARQTDRRTNDAILENVLDAFGYRRSRDWIKTQLRKLEELGAVTITAMGSVYVAEITRSGLDHVENRSVIEGVARPSPEV